MCSAITNVVREESMIGSRTMRREDTKHLNFESHDSVLRFCNKLIGSASTIKRLMDVAIGLPLLIAVFPFLVLIADALKLDSA